MKISVFGREIFLLSVFGLVIRSFHTLRPIQYIIYIAQKLGATARNRFLIRNLHLQKDRIIEKSSHFLGWS